MNLTIKASEDVVDSEGVISVSSRLPKRSAAEPLSGARGSIICCEHVDAFQRRGRTGPDTASVSRRPLAQASVLLVEDEDILRLSVAKMLRKNGFSVVEARDGTLAVELLRGHQERIDVVLLDVTIPGSSSREVIAEARRIRPDIKVVLTSAYSREMLRPPLDAPQIKGFIRKPFQLGELVQVLREVLAQ